MTNACVTGYYYQAQEPMSDYDGEGIVARIAAYLGLYDPQRRHMNTLKALEQQANGKGLAHEANESMGQPHDSELSNSQAASELHFSQEMLAENTTPRQTEARSFLEVPDDQHDKHSMEMKDTSESQVIVEGILQNLASTSDSIPPPLETNECSADNAQTLKNPLPMLTLGTIETN